MTIEDMLKTAGLDSPAITAAKERQLHLSAVGLAKTAGVPVDGEFDIKSALHLLGRKVYTKRAEWRMVNAGLDALRSLHE